VLEGVAPIHTLPLRSIIIPERTLLIDVLSDEVLV
jgi:hypothetical protein